MSVDKVLHVVSLYMLRKDTNNGNCKQVLIHHNHLKQALNEVSSFLGNELERRCQGCKEHRNLSATPRDCQNLQELGYKSTGVYTIYPKTGASFQVRWDMSTAGGGWTVIQRRVSAIDFYKTWNEYKVGFGHLDVNFWLGNDKIYTLTNSGSYSLRVDLVAPDGEAGYATYSSFSIGSEAVEYRLSISNISGGNIGDCLYDLYNGVAFSTKDQDNDLQSDNCAEQFSGAWWYGYGCHRSNLNGVYGSSGSGKGLNWGTWKGFTVSMTSTQMAIKRV